jgi:mannose-6-phosphate isomerase-like protein (cupin superfamily)
MSRPASSSWSRFTLAKLEEQQARGTRPYLEFLRTAALSAGVYRLSAGGRDPQRPHPEDELYLVTSGSAAIEVDEERVPVGIGSIIYVPAGVPHRFLDISSDLTVLVMFAPAETER